mgnify:CR=1 FL=1
MPIYNGYPQVFYPQQPQGQLEQLRAAQYQPQPVMMPTMQGQAAPTDSGFIWVQGEAAARGYLVANGSRVLLLDADSDTFYIKEVGQDGRPFPLRIYDYKERTSGPKASIAATQAAGGEYVTRKEFDELAAKLAAAVSARWVPPRPFSRACSVGEKTRCTKAGFCSFAAMRSAAQRSVPMPKIILSSFSFQLNANSNSAALSFSTRPSITAVSSRCRVAPTAGPAGRPASIRSPPFTASWRMV